MADSLPKSGDSIELLYACKSANDNRSRKFIGILAGCFGGLALLGLIGVICYVKYQLGDLDSRVL